MPTLSKGDYGHINPNDHVNLCQSTNDAYPSAAKIAVVLKHRALVKEMRHLVKAMRTKGGEFDHVIKMGRTQLQDAVPMTLGQEFNAMAATMQHDMAILESVIEQFYTLNLGGTAIGTGICADERFAACAIKHLSEITGMGFQSLTLYALIRDVLSPATSEPTT
jgi:aspartate ammonia-lyase